MLPTFTYDIHSGPVVNPSDIPCPLEKGNCRLAVQLYFYLIHQTWFSADAILCPALYRATGVLAQEGVIDLTQLHEGDVILAERRRNIRGEEVDRSRSFYATEDEWMIYLHSAIICSTFSQRVRVWHATAIAGSTCEWGWEEFLEWYRPVAVKRVLAGKTC